jgi:hypothetical protein
LNKIFINLTKGALLWAFVLNQKLKNLFYK